MDDYPFTSLLSFPNAARQRSKQFWTRPVLYQGENIHCSSPYHQRRALHHCERALNGKNDLKLSVYWKCSLQPQRTLPGHWLIKANLCSLCVFQSLCPYQYCINIQPNGSCNAVTQNRVLSLAFPHYQGCDREEMQEDVASEQADI